LSKRNSPEGAAKRKAFVQSSSRQSNLEANGSYLLPMSLAVKSIIRTTTMDNKKPIATIKKKKGTDTAAIPNLSAVNEMPKTMQMSQIMEKYRGIHLHQDLGRAGWAEDLSPRHRP
jgi:hypothetical protein